MPSHPSSAFVLKRRKAAKYIHTQAGAATLALQLLWMDTSHAGKGVTVSEFTRVERRGRPLVSVKWALVFPSYAVARRGRQKDASQSRRRMGCLGLCGVNEFVERIWEKIVLYSLDLNRAYIRVFWGFNAFRRKIFRIAKWCFLYTFMTRSL